MKRFTEKGAATVEMALALPAFILILLFVLYVSRVVDAGNAVQSAAQEAARAATLTATPAEAETEAQRVAAANLTQVGLGCSGGSQVTVDVSDFTAGGYATVSVTCEADFSDLTSLGLGGSRTFKSQASEIIDAHRSP